MRLSVPRCMPVKAASFFWVMPRRQRSLRSRKGRASGAIGVTVTVITSETLDTASHA
jgi:hypothetical protein